ncbi:MAG: hypothetical protein AB7F98_00640 [Novosphingobium sp.]
MKYLVLATVISAISAAPALADDAAASAPAAPAYSTSDSTIGTLLDNPATKAVLEKHVAAMVGNPQIEMARGMTLKQIQGFAGDALSDEVLAQIDADLATIPTK